VHYTKIFHVAIKRQEQVSNLVQVPVVQKWLGTKKFVRTKSGIGSKFYKIFFGSCVQEELIVHLYCCFSLWCQMALQQSTKFRTAFFGQFCTSLRKDSIASYAWILTLFSPSVRGLEVL